MNPEHTSSLAYRRSQGEISTSPVKASHAQTHTHTQNLRARKPSAQDSACRSLSSKSSSFHKERFKQILYTVFPRVSRSLSVHELLCSLPFWFSSAQVLGARLRACGPIASGMPGPWIHLLGNQEYLELHQLDDDGERHGTALWQIDHIIHKKKEGLWLNARLFAATHVHLNWWLTTRGNLSYIYVQRLRGCRKAKRHRRTRVSF